MVILHLFSRETPLLSVRGFNGKANFHFAQELNSELASIARQYTDPIHGQRCQKVDSLGAKNRVSERKI